MWVCECAYVCVFVSVYAFVRVCAVAYGLCMCVCACVRVRACAFIIPLRGCVDVYVHACVFGWDDNFYIVPHNQ